MNVYKTELRSIIRPILNGKGVSEWHEDILQLRTMRRWLDEGEWIPDTDWQDVARNILEPIK